MPFNESPCFNCGRLPSEGHTARCNADFNPAFEEDEPSTVPPGTGDTWSAPLRRPVQPKRDRCDQCGAERADWQDDETDRCPDHANHLGSCDGTLRKQLDSQERLEEELARQKRDGVGVFDRRFGDV